MGGKTQIFLFYYILFLLFFLLSLFFFLHDFVFYPYIDGTCTDLALRHLVAHIKGTFIQLVVIFYILVCVSGECSTTVDGVTYAVSGGHVNLMGLQDIPDYAFYKCYSLSSLTFGAHIASIGAHAFQETSISSINIPGTCNNLNTFTFL